MFDKCMSVLENTQQTSILVITSEQLDQPGHICIIASFDELFIYTKIYDLDLRPDFEIK